MKEIKMQLMENPKKKLHFSNEKYISKFSDYYFIKWGTIKRANCPKQ